MTDISSYRWVGANFKPHLKMNDNQQTQLTISNLDQQTRKELRQHFRQQPPQPKRRNDLIPDLKRNLTHGWLLPYLGQIDNLLWGRWQYWARCQVVPQSAWMRWKMEPAYAKEENRQPEHLPKFVIEQTLPDDPIPQIEWHYNSATESMLHNSFNCIPRHGEWRTRGSWTYLEYFLDWALFGFGHPAYRTLPEETTECKGASMRLYQIFDLSLLLLFPEDYLGRILPEICDKTVQRNQGFYPTPLTISTFMAKIVNLDDSLDHRTQSFYEPSCGTGTLMLAQSNYTLCGIGQDIEPILLKCALFQFYLYSPWYACPIWWLGNTDLLLGNSLSNEKPVSLNAVHWANDWFEPIETVEPNNTDTTDSSETLSATIEQLQTNKQVCSTQLPPNPIAQEVLNGQKRKKQHHAQTGKQLTIFELNNL